MWGGCLPYAGLWTGLMGDSCVSCPTLPPVHPPFSPPSKHAHTQDEGKGMSIWDAFSHTPGKISGNASGDISTCHFYR